MDVSRYHKFLRVSALLCALVLVFDSGILFSETKMLSDHTINYMASVGNAMFASVPPNEINTLSAELAEQQRLLDAREVSLREREIAARKYDTGDIDYSVYILSTILFILTALIILNYILDWNRFKRLIHESQVT
jgi:hypothetical protein